MYIYKIYKTKNKIKRKIEENFYFISPLIYIPIPAQTPIHKYIKNIFIRKVWDGGLKGKQKQQQWKIYKILFSSAIYLLLRK